MIVCACAPSTYLPTRESGTWRGSPRADPSATPERDALTASAVYQAVDYLPITRDDLVGGYLNLPGLHKADPTP